MFSSPESPLFTVRIILKSLQREQDAVDQLYLAGQNEVSRGHRSRGSEVSNLHTNTDVFVISPCMSLHSDEVKIDWRRKKKANLFVNSETVMMASRCFHSIWRKREQAD